MVAGRVAGQAVCRAAAVDQAVVLEAAELKEPVLQQLNEGHAAARGWVLDLGLQQLHAVVEAAGQEDAIAGLGGVCDDLTGRVPHELAEAGNVLVLLGRCRGAIGALRRPELGEELVGVVPTK